MTDKEIKLPKQIMIQGTTSDSGKSTIVAALCRLLADRGCRVLPFKSQNMSLNSAVTHDGGEIGRAQALQAQAAKVEPSIDMNPVLLKPSTEGRSQVILQGKAISEMSARDYYSKKKLMFDTVLDSYNRLRSQADCIVIEGAGSPAEINLREHDIANMGLAEEVNCPVVLVSDIDRGGVFAHIVGTLELLSKPEQKRVIGVIINQFRGDINLLMPGIEWLEKKINKPVFGVLPYIHGLQLDAEDSIALKKKSHVAQSIVEDSIKVVVPLYPKTSNFTDLDPIVSHSAFSISWIKENQTIPPADLVILLGSKNVSGDLFWLYENQWDKYIQKHLRYGGKVLGICGGLQMLGHKIHDPMGYDGQQGVFHGLKLLPLSTTMHKTKTLKQVQGILELEGTSYCLEGYEIHLGQTLIDENMERPIVINGEKQGCLSVDNQIMGTYVHGFFEHPDIIEAIMKWCRYGGEAYLEDFNYQNLRETQLDLIASELEKHIKINQLLTEASEFEERS